MEVCTVSEDEQFCRCVVANNGDKELVRTLTWEYCISVQ